MQVGKNQKGLFAFLENKTCAFIHVLHFSNNILKNYMNIYTHLADDCIKLEWERFGFF